MIIPALLFGLMIGLTVLVSYFLLDRSKRHTLQESAEPVADALPPTPENVNTPTSPVTTLVPWHDDLNGVIKTLADGLIVLDTALNPKIVNDSAHSLLGIPKEFRGFEDISQLFPLEVNISEKIKEAITFDRTVTLHEVLINKKTFQIFITPLSDTNISYQNNSERYITGASILLQDITAEKSAQKVKEEFSHLVVHDLRAPVVAIKDTASLLLGGRLNAEETRNMLNLVHDQSNKLLSQISTILDAAKLDDGKLVLKKNPGDISIVIQEQLSVFTPEAKRKNITMIAEIGNDLPVVYFDKLRISEVISNVISNSLKYTNENGIIKITVDADDNYHRARLDENDKGNIVITISDNGMGIPQDKQHLLFTKFGQVDSANTSTETKKVSTGLGLYITKGIVDAHHGTISMSSKEGQGTSTTITLPIKPSQEDIDANRTQMDGLPPHPVLN